MLRREKGGGREEGRVLSEGSIEFGKHRKDGREGEENGGNVACEDT